MSPRFPGEAKIQLESTVRAACRRRLVVLAIEQLALALAPVLAGGVLILLLGTDILKAWWLGLLATAGLAFAFVRIRGRRLPQYKVAQIVDRRLKLSDSLSTAWYLLSNREADQHPMARFQIERAANVAAEVRASRAFPLTGGRAWLLTGALAAVALGLFTLRYLVTNTLNVEHAFIPIHFGAVFENSLLAKTQDRTDLPAVDPQQNEITKGEQPSDSHQQAAEQREPGAGESDSSGASQQQASNSDLQRANQNGSSENHGGDSSAKQMAGENANSAEKQTHSQQASREREKFEGGQPGSSGLLDKMKDALSSLMAKMRPNQSQDGSPQNGDRQSDSQARGNQLSAGKEQQSKQDGRNQQASQDPSSEAQAQGLTSEKPQASQGKSSGQSPQNGSDSHSGIGRQDGDKQLKEAEQLRAMGKLAEIIGKRSASLTGDMTIETPSGKQQLKTEYSQRVGHHADLGGEINRDEIPIADQQYIREYMELVRKQNNKPN